MLSSLVLPILAFGTVDCVQIRRHWEIRMLLVFKGNRPSSFGFVGVFIALVCTLHCVEAIPARLRIKTRHFWYLANVFNNLDILSTLSLGCTFDPPRAYLALALCVNPSHAIFYSLLQIKIVSFSISQQSVRHIRALNLHLDGRGFHPRSKVDCVPEECKFRHRFADNSRNDRPAGQSCSDAYAGTILCFYGFANLHRIQCK
mmetsp:Transcript_12009/g.28341  ORF Transcript_12009/g.28341 Transcript_12009/m.28341 type:complete len:202 (-) Transcript_12009:2135-2740(-)